VAAEGESGITMQQLEPLHRITLERISAYLQEKEDMGLIRSWWFLSTRNDKHIFHHAISGPSKIYMNLLCPTLAQLYCSGQLIICIKQSLSIFPPYVYCWTISAYPRTICTPIPLDKGDIESVTAHLRKSDNTLWEKEKGPYGDMASCASGRFTSY